jgi:hypothetical protein
MTSVASIEQQGTTDLVGDVARIALPVHHLALILSLSIMATETVAERSGTEGGPLWMGWIPWFAVGRHMATWNHDGIALDRFIVHNTGMAGRTALSLSTNRERIHMLTMTHDQAHLLHRYGEIAGCNFRDAKDMPMTAQAYV